jgi:hypothetical protein
MVHNIFVGLGLDILMEISLVDDIEMISIVTGAAATKVKCTLANTFTRPLIPDLDPPWILTNINRNVTTRTWSATITPNVTISISERCYSRTVWYIPIIFHLYSSSPRRSRPMISRTRLLWKS